MSRQNEIIPGYKTYRIRLVGYFGDRQRKATYLVPANSDNDAERLGRQTFERQHGKPTNGYNVVTKLVANVYRQSRD